MNFGRALGTLRPGIKPDPLWARQALYPINITLVPTQMFLPCSSLCSTRAFRFQVLQRIKYPFITEYESGLAHGKTSTFKKCKTGTAKLRRDAAKPLKSKIHLCLQERVGPQSSPLYNHTYIHHRLLKTNLCRSGLQAENSGAFLEWGWAATAATLMPHSHHQWPSAADHGAPEAHHCTWHLRVLKYWQPGRSTPDCLGTQNRGQISSLNKKHSLASSKQLSKTLKTMTSGPHCEI